MWPLLQRDGLGLQYVVLPLMWNYLIGYNPFAGLLSTRKTFVAWIATVSFYGVRALTVA